MAFGLLSARGNQHRRFVIRAVTGFDGPVDAECYQQAIGLEDEHQRLCTFTKQILQEQPQVGEFLEVHVF